MQHIACQRGERLQPINRRGAEAHRARVGVVAADRRDLTDLEPESRSLDEHLRVENEVVAVLEKRDRLQEAPSTRDSRCGTRTASSRGPGFLTRSENDCPIVSTMACRPLPGPGRANAIQARCPPRRSRSFRIGPG